MGKMRKKFATQYGFVVPEVRLTDDMSIPGKSYQIKIHGTVVAEHEMRVGELMVLLGKRDLPDIPGEEVREPAFGMRAYLGAGNVRRGSASASSSPTPTTCRSS